MSSSRRGRHQKGNETSAVRPNHPVQQAGLFWKNECTLGRPPAHRQRAICLVWPNSKCTFAYASQHLSAQQRNEPAVAKCQATSSTTTRHGRVTCSHVGTSQNSSSPSEAFDCRYRLSADQSRCVMAAEWPAHVPTRETPPLVSYLSGGTGAHTLRQLNLSRAGKTNGAQVD